MKRQSLVLLAVAFAAAGVAGCFKDPVSGLRSGPTIVNLDHTSIYVAVGDSTVVTATVTDNGGNVLPETDAVWTSGDPAVAVVRKDTTAVIPGDYFTRAFIRGVLSTGGITNVTIQTRGLTATVRVIVTPPQIPAAQHSLSGGPSADTVIVPLQIGPPIVPPDTVAYTAGDTLTINGTGFLNFDTSKVAVYVAGVAGSFPGYVFAKTPTQLQVGFLTGASGRVWVKNLLMVTGDTSVGTQPLDSLVTADSVLIARLRFKGAITQLGDTMTIQAGTGQTFTASTGVTFGANSAIILTQTASAMNVLSPATSAVRCASPA